MSKPPATHDRPGDYDPSGAAYRGWNEPNLGYRPANGYDYPPADAVAHSAAGRGPKAYTRSDTRIYEDVCDRLSDDPWIDATDIEVTVQDGRVSLCGTVDERRAKRRSQEIVEAISGVREVDNRLRTEPGRRGG